MQDLSGIAVFAAVVDAGSFTGAAEALGLSKSAVSKQITKLEQRLGAQLLHRTTRRLSLTEVGQAFYERCRRIVSEAEEAELAVTHLQEVPRGTLRVSAPLSFGLAHLVQALPVFMQQFPELSVDIDFADRRVDLIEEGYDIALRVGELSDSSLIARKIATSRRMVLGSPDFWKKHGIPKTPEELVNYPCLTFAYLQIPRTWHFRNPETGVDFTLKVSGPMHANNGNALAKAAIGGIGAVLSPYFICREAILSGTLVPVLEEFEPPPLPINAIYPPNRHLSAKVRSFIDFLARRFAVSEENWP